MGGGEGEAAGREGSPLAVDAVVGLGIALGRCCFVQGMAWQSACDESQEWQLGSAAAMLEPDPPDLFAVVGIVLDAELKPPTRTRKPRPPSPAERAAAVRLEGGRRSRGQASPGQRTRVGQPRRLEPAPIIAFPLSRNVKAIAEVIARLPHGYASDLNRRRDQEVRRLQKGLVERGVPNKAAWLCARELVHVAYIQRVRDAHKEAGIL